MTFRVRNLCLVCIMVRRSDWRLLKYFKYILSPEITLQGSLAKAALGTPGFGQFSRITSSCLRTQGFADSCSHTDSRSGEDAPWAVLLSSEDSFL